MWKYYQPAIMNKMFYPFIFYMLTYMYMVSHVTAELLDSSTPIDEQPQGTFVSLILLLIADTLLWAFFF